MVLILQTMQEQSNRSTVRPQVPSQQVQGMERGQPADEV